jgi:hypothetical protein
MPSGEYATVEIVGRRTLVGRVTEVDRFGTKLLQVEPLFNGHMLAPVFVGGSSSTSSPAATQRRRCDARQSRSMTCPARSLTPSRPN